MLDEPDTMINLPDGYDARNSLFIQLFLLGIQIVQVINFC